MRRIDYQVCNVCGPFIVHAQLIFENFTVKTMSQCEEELCQDEEGIGYLITLSSYGTYW